MAASLVLPALMQEAADPAHTMEVGVRFGSSPWAQAKEDVLRRPVDQRTEQQHVVAVVADPLSKGAHRAFAPSFRRTPNHCTTTPSRSGTPTQAPKTARDFRYSVQNCAFRLEKRPFQRQRSSIGTPVGTSAANARSIVASGTPSARRAALDVATLAGDLGRSRRGPFRPPARRCAPPAARRTRPSPDARGRCRP